MSNLFFVVTYKKNTLFFVVQNRNNECPVVYNVSPNLPEKGFEYDYDDIIDGFTKWSKGEVIDNALSFISYEDKKFLIDCFNKAS